MILAWIFLSLILNISCLRSVHGSGRHTEHLTREKRKDDPSESDDYFSCRWEEPPENAQYFRICALGECGVTLGSYSQNGTKRITRCNPHYTLIRGLQTDLCLNGEWSSRGHKCVQCGRSPRIFDELGAYALIINGVNSLTGDFPWMAAIFTPRTAGQWTLICGGTLISPTIVLTAGHCLNIGGKRQSAEDIKVGLGRLSANFSTNEPGSVVALVKEIVLPRRFVGHERLYDLDIGLIVLQEPVLLNALIMPACIDWSASKQPKQNEHGVLAGWGLANVDGFRSENLKWTYQKYMEYRECLKVMRPTDRKFLSPDKFCADQVKGGETENGDSGGGLTFVRDEVHYVYGIVSTKMIMKAKQLRLYTNLMDVVHHTWLAEEWRKIQTRQQQEISTGLSSFDKMSGCTKDAECPDNKRCVGLTCLDLCPSACGSNSVCRMVNHLPVCTCRPSHKGNPYDACTKDENTDSPKYTGPISSNGRKECTDNAQCPDDKRCVGQTCLDTCQNACGANSVCRMVNHHPICSCNPGYTGNPFNVCTKAENTDLPEESSAGCRWMLDSFDAQVPRAAESCSITEDPSETSLLTSVKRNEFPYLGELNATCLNTDTPGKITPSMQGEFPYLGIIGDDQFNITHNGVLISEQWFLSTASCYSAQVCNKKVKLGISDGSNRNVQRMPVYDVIEEHLHPDYEDISKHNIGLFKLKTAVRFTQFIQPACLVQNHQPPGTEGVVIGKLNGVLSKTTTKVLPENKCKATTSNFLDASMLCVNVYRSPNSLRMYAGFPMMGPVTKPYCKYGLLGLATFGKSGQPEGYMRLSFYLPWIENTIRPQS